jgi:hypothetical protein
MFNEEFMWHYSGSNGVDGQSQCAPDGSYTTDPDFVFPDHIDFQVSLAISKKIPRMNGDLIPRKIFSYDDTVYNFVMKVWANPEGFLRIAPLHCVPRVGGHVMIYYMARYMLEHQPWHSPSKESLLRDYALYLYQDPKGEWLSKEYDMYRYRDDCLVTF